MRMTPIIALVNEQTLAELTRVVSNAPPPPKAWQDVMDRNGWTLEHVVAGDAIACGFGLDAQPDPNPQQEVNP